MLGILATHLLFIMSFFYVEEFQGSNNTDSIKIRIFRCTSKCILLDNYLYSI